MLQAFIILLREGFEAFLIVAIMLAYLRRSTRPSLVAAVYAGAAASVFASVGIGLLMRRGARLPLWEGIFGLLALPLVVGLVIHMHRIGPLLKGRIEKHIEHTIAVPSTFAAASGVFACTLLMITREGMETTLLLFQVRGGLLGGALLGLAGALGMAWLWSRVGSAIDLRRFFQVTGAFLILFSIQIAITAFHELAEAGVLPNSAMLHAITEPYGPEGVYGRWLSFGMVGVPAVWLMGVWMREHLHIGHHPHVT